MDIVFTPHRPREQPDGILVPPRSNPPSPIIEPAVDEPIVVESSEDDAADAAGGVVEYTVSSSGSSNTLVDENGAMMPINAAPEVNSLDPYFGQLEEVLDERNARSDEVRVPIDVVADTPRLLAGAHCAVSQKINFSGAFLHQTICKFSPTMNMKAIHSQNNCCNTLLTSVISPLINWPPMDNGQIRMACMPTPALVKEEEIFDNNTGQIWDEEPSKFEESSISSKNFLKKLTILEFLFIS